MNEEWVFDLRGFRGEWEDRIGDSGYKKICFFEEGNREMEW